MKRPASRRPRSPSKGFPIPENRKRPRQVSHRAALPGSLDAPYADEQDDDFYDDDPKPDRGALRIPVRWVNTIIGLFLLPLAWVWTESFFSLFSRQHLDYAFWASEEFWFFSLGSLLWLIAFFGLPKPVSLYVFGHELTHAIWVWLMGGRVSKFKFGSEGGYILTDKQNVWISLAPYFYPIYSVAVIILYFVASLFWDVAPHTRWLFLALGVTWSFHISFTLWMIPKGQTDLSYHGTFYSLVIIYLMNLALLTALLILAAPEVSFKGFISEFARNGKAFLSSASELLHLLLAQWQAARGV